MSDALDEIPERATVIGISRRDPPPAFARGIANEKVAIVDWEALRLRPEEAQAIAARRSVSADVIARLFALSEGWAAGFTLLIEQSRHGYAVTAADRGDSLGAVFDYFAGQLLERVAPNWQRLLLQLSFLPRVTIDNAIALTESEDVSALLEDLHRRHLFTDRRHAGEIVYQFHALLQAFLQHHASRTLSLTEQTELTVRAARLLERSTEPEGAFPLFLRAGNVDEAQALILREAPKLIGQGRWKVVVDWIEAMPPKRVEADCWLMHWLGTAQIMVAPRRARALLELSAGSAERNADSLCLLQAAAGIVQAYMLEYVQYRPLDRWIEVLQAGLASQPEFPDGASELRAYSALLIALAYRRPSSAILSSYAQRVLDLSRNECDINLRALAVAYVVAYGSTTGPLELSRRGRPLLEQLLRAPGVTALTLAWGGFIASFSYMLTGDEDECLAAVMRVEKLGVDENLPAAVRLAAIIGGWLEIGAGRRAASRRWLRRLREVAVPGNLYDEASAASIDAQLHLHEGNRIEAEIAVARAMELFDDAGTHFHRTYLRSQRAWTAIVAGDTLSARRWIDEGLTLARETRTGWLEVEACIADAYCAHLQDDRADFERRLRVAFELGRRVDCIWAFKFSRPWMSLLAAKAIDAGIEADYVRSVVQRMQLPPLDPESDTWPWPIWIHTLGRFEVIVGGEVLRFSRKTPRKPLALLKALIALGGAEVPEHRLIDALWPDEEGDAARKAYTIAMHRLRQLLGASDAVTVDGGALALNPNLCWLDIWSFERHLAKANAFLSSGNNEGFVRAAQDAERLYRGGFLAGDPEEQWPVPLRERLRGKFTRLVEVAAHRLEQTGEYDRARDWYLRGLEADDLAEAFYQGLMRCYQATGRRSEALSVFRRLRRTLSVTLGIHPSEQSEALYKSLLAS